MQEPSGQLLVPDLSRLPGQNRSQAIESLCGYELPLIGACVLHPDDEVLTPIRELASSERISVVVGAPIEAESDGIHIGAVTFWSPEGALVVAAPDAGQCLVIASKDPTGWSGALRQV